MQPNFQTLTFPVPRKVHKQIKELAKADDRSMRSMLVKLITEAAAREAEAQAARANP